MKFIATVTAPILALMISSVSANTPDTNPQNTIEWCPLSSNAELSDSHTMQVSHQTQYAKHDGSEYRERAGTKFPKRIVPQGKRIFFFSPRLRAWAAYNEQGIRVGYGRANGGSHWCDDLGRPCRTPRGEFHVRSKGSPNCKSGRFPLPNGGAPMPYCMFFSGGYAIHGSPGISNNNSSHGCIRVYNQAAYWLSNHFIKIGTRVVVLSY